MQQRLKYIYKRMLKEDGTITDLHKIMAFYRDYDKLVALIKNNPEVPNLAYTFLPSIKMPKYLQWMKTYLKRKSK